MSSSINDKEKSDVLNYIKKYGPVSTSVIANDTHIAFYKMNGTNREEGILSILEKEKKIKKDIRGNRTYWKAT